MARRGGSRRSQGRGGRNRGGNGRGRSRGRSKSNAVVGRAVLYIDGVRKPFHLTNLWKSDSKGVIMSGKTGAEFLDEKIVDALDRALDRDKDVRVVIYEPYDEKERRRQKDRREDEELEDDEIEDPEDDELLDDDDIPF